MYITLIGSSACLEDAEGPPLYVRLLLRRQGHRPGDTTPVGELYEVEGVEILIAVGELWSLACAYIKDDTHIVRVFEELPE